jgi:hypothetical protein
MHGIIIISSCASCLGACPVERAAAEPRYRRLRDVEGAGNIGLRMPFCESLVSFLTLVCG